MRTLDRYILREFGKIFSITVLSFISVFMIVDVFENMDDLMEHGVPLWVGVGFFLYKFPYIFGQVLPVSILLSVLISIGIFSRNGELTAVKASGISLLRVLSPLFMCGLVASVGVMFINESITPVTMKKVNSIRKTWLEDIKMGVFGKRGFWLRGGDGIYNIKEMDLKNNTLRGVVLYEFGRGFEFTGRIQAREVVWRNDNWRADNATGWGLSGGRVVRKKVDKVVFDGLKSPDELVSAERGYEQMGLVELYRYIQGLEKEGYDTSRYRVDLYSKITFPLVNFIMVLVGIPFALKTGRSGGIAVGVGLSVIIGFSYWIIFAISRSLGHSGVFPPLFSAVFPDIFFFAVGVFMLSGIRQ